MPGTQQDSSSGSPEAASITDPVSVWNDAELSSLKADYRFADGASQVVSKYNPTPGSGRTGFMSVAPNNYPFYKEHEKYIPVMQQDGGQLSEWQPMYNPTSEQAELDRKLAYERGVPHGYVAPGDKYRDLPTVSMKVCSELHDEDEYGANVDEAGKHSGGPFEIQISLKMRVEDIRKVIYEKGGILPGLQRLSYAGKNLEDPQRTLEQYGIAYWHGKFPDWPLKIRRY